jgi:hypothetical protein
VVSSVLAECFGDAAEAARALQISVKDLRRIAWKHPKVLEAARERCSEATSDVWDELLGAFYGGDERRRLWASERILASPAARNHPFAPARLWGRQKREEASAVTFSWVDAPAVEGDGKDVLVEGAVSEKPLPDEPSRAPPLPPREAPVLPASLPRWPGPYPAPPLIAHLYAPWNLGGGGAGFFHDFCFERFIGIRAVETNIEDLLFHYGPACGQIADCIGRVLVGAVAQETRRFGDQRA